MKTRRWLVALVVAAVAFVGLTACSNNAQPIGSTTSTTSTTDDGGNNDNDYQDALPATCVRAKSTTPGYDFEAICADAFTTFPLISGKEWSRTTKCLPAGVIVKVVKNNDGTWTATATSTNPAVTIHGFSYDQWMNNKVNELDDFSPSPYTFTPKPDQSQVAMHFDAPGYSMWDRVKPQPSFGESTLVACP